MTMSNHHKKRILTVGVFDYFHYGHLRLFRQIKDAYPDSHFIVAVQESEYIKKFKPEASVFYSTEVRCELIGELRCVDEVITYQDALRIVQTIDFDMFAVGEDQQHEGFKRAEEYCLMNGREILRLHRTPNISSSTIKKTLESTNPRSTHAPNTQKANIRLVQVAEKLPKKEDDEKAGEGAE